MSQLQSVQIERFKAIEEAPFDLDSLNVLVGANNSGKSSIIQGLHFGIGLLQTILLKGSWPGGDAISMSLNPTQLIYSPSENVSALALGGNLLEAKESSIRLELTLDSGEKPSVSIRKGRNRNILVSVEQAQAAKQLASLDRPFSIFSPGLAGIAKTEQYLSDGVLLRTIARGDANLVLRNNLLRLWDTSEWDAFLSDLLEIFPQVRFKVEFNEKTDEFITVYVKGSDKEWLPLELAGTGVLQATQILSYIHRFSPSIVVLDEPDSHLHPNNQRLLCALLRKVAEERSTQILLTTHSRHVVDVVSGTAKFLWVRNGTVDPAGEDDEIGILMDIGALDIKERINHPGTKAIVLTEDENVHFLETLLKSSSFSLDETIILPYYGVSTHKQLRPLLQVIQDNNPAAKVIVHRDRDYMTDEEGRKWEEKIRPLGVEPFLTKGVDLESHFLEAKHLAATNESGSESEFEELIQRARELAKDKSVEHYVNGRIEVERANGTHAKINHGNLAVEAAQIVGNNLASKSHGKTVLKQLRKEFRTKYSVELQVVQVSEHIAVHELRTIANKTFGKQEKLT